MFLTGGLPCDFRLKMIQSGFGLYVWVCLLDDEAGRAAVGRVYELDIIRAPADAPSRPFTDKAIELAQRLHPNIMPRLLTQGVPE